MLWAVPPYNARVPLRGLDETLPAKAATLLLALALVSGPAWAEPSVSDAPTPAAGKDVFQARLRYGASLRSGSQNDATSPGLTYSGATPNDLALSGWGWFLLSQHLGAQLSFQREAFGLFDGSTRVTGGGLLKAGLGVAGRYWFGPLTIELDAGYAYQQLALFTYSADYVLSPGTRHAVLLAARAMVDVGPVTVEGRGEYPLTLAATDGAGKAVTASGYAAGGGVRLQLFSVGALRWGLLADLMFVSDTMKNPAGLSASQQMIRLGGAIDLKYQEEQTAGPSTGALVVTVVDSDGQARLGGASVTVGGQTVTADATGLASFSGVPLGAVEVKGSAGGYLPGEAPATVDARQPGALLLQLKKEPPRVGAVAVTVLDRETKKPLPGAKVSLGEQTAQSDQQGKASFSQLPPGPVGLKVSLDGYNPGEEAAQVAAGSVAAVEVVLAPAKKRLPATISGLVRSTVGGKAIAASLELPEAKIKTKANEKGAFTFDLPGGGTYTMRISARGFIAQTKSVTVKDGEEAIFNVDLHPK